MEERLPHEVRLGQAFCSLLETIDPKRLPLHGGDATTMVVTVDLAEARRLACTAGVVPVVLGGESEVLDLGVAAAGLPGPAQGDRGPRPSLQGSGV